MANLFSKILKRKDVEDESGPQFSPSEFNVPRYDAIRALIKKGRRCRIWNDEALKRFGLRVESKYPNLLCILVPDTTTASVCLITSGWKYIGQATDEMQGMISDPFLSPSFLIRPPTDTTNDGVPKRGELRRQTAEEISKPDEPETPPKLETTNYDNPLIALIPGEKYRYNFSENLSKNVPSVPGYISGLMYRYINTPHIFETSQAVTLESLKQFYQSGDLPELKDKKFEKRLAKEFRQLHQDLINSNDWEHFRTKEAEDKYEKIYREVRKL